MKNSKKIRRLLFVLFLLGLFVGTPNAKAQVHIELSKEIMKVGGKEYYMHHVKSGETLWGISKVYQVSVEEIERINPELKDGLKYGTVIGIPVRTQQVNKNKPVRIQKDGNQDVPKDSVHDEQNVMTQPQSQAVLEGKTAIDNDYPVIERSKEITKIGSKEYYLHYVKSGQTLTAISNVYQVTIDEIIRLNPELKDGLKAGYVIGIPVLPIQEPDVAQIEELEVPKLEEPVAPKIEESVVPKIEEQVAPKIEEPVAPKIEEPIAPEVEEPVAPEVEESVAPKIEEPIAPKIEEPVASEVEKPVAPKIEESVAPEVEEPSMAVVEEPIEAPVAQPVQAQPKEPIIMKVGDHYVVQAGEDLYDIAKKFGIDVADFKAVNPGLTNYPAAGQSILVPDIHNENDYIIHKVEYSERTTSLLKRWKVMESDFRMMNVSTGSHVFVNQVVLIPIEPVRIIVESDEEGLDDEEEEEIVTPVVEERPKKPFFDEIPDFEPECKSSPENASKCYKVVLMVPLYLYDIDNISTSKDRAAKSQKSRSMSFLQFYEGFMMAVENLRDKEGMKLDLTVIDVTDNVSSAHQALSQIEGKDFDLIVGPFFSKSFSIIEEYAKANNILMVNPLSTRSSVIENNPNVVKVKPGDVGQILTISNLIKNYYNDANVFIVSREDAADTVYLNQLEHHLNLAVNEEVTVSGDEFLQFARNESERLEMGSRMVSTVDVEGQVYSTDVFQNGETDKVVLHNSVKRYSYSDMGKLKSQLSGVRDNLIIAYGNDNVFATQVLNSLTKDADRFPITLVCVPDWTRFEKLLVDNLLKMHAIYVNDFFVDYRSEAAKRFVLRFRNRYACEPQQYAFEGYDIATYFITALMRYGDDVMDCLHCHAAPLLHTNYRFYNHNYLQTEQQDGKENLYWSVYQYDKNNIELVPIDPFKKAN